MALSFLLGIKVKMSDPKFLPQDIYSCSMSPKDSPLLLNKHIKYLACARHWAGKGSCFKNKQDIVKLSTNPIILKDYEWVFSTDFGCFWNWSLCLLKGRTIFALYLDLIEVIKKSIQSKVYCQLSQNLSTILQFAKELIQPKNKVWANILTLNLQYFWWLFQGYFKLLFPKETI